jgi:6,7-dimethyl-8-ribityllumazine synthase
MTRTYEGSFDARDLRVAVIASRFNDTITKRLVEGAIDGLTRHGAADDRVSITWVPGAFELPAAAARMAATGEIDAVICLGVVIRGETPHFDYVAGGAATGIAQAAATSGIPVIFGVLTTDTTDQAEARAGGKMGNKGFDSALAAIEMANLFATMPKPRSEL